MSFSLILNIIWSLAVYFDLEVQFGSDFLSLTWTNLNLLILILRLTLILKWLMALTTDIVHDVDIKLSLYLNLDFIFGYPSSGLDLKKFKSV